MSNLLKEWLETANHLENPRKYIREMALLSVRDGRITRGEFMGIMTDLGYRNDVAREDLEEIERMYE